VTFADDDLKRLKEWDASAMKADDEEVWGEFKDGCVRNSQLSSPGWKRRSSP